MQDGEDAGREAGGVRRWCGRMKRGMVACGPARPAILPEAPAQHLRRTNKSSAADCCVHAAAVPLTQAKLSCDGKEDLCGPCESESEGCGNAAAGEGQAGADRQPQHQPPTRSTPRRCPLTLRRCSRARQSAAGNVQGRQLLRAAELIPLRTCLLLCASAGCPSGSAYTIRRHPPAMTRATRASRSTSGRPPVGQGQPSRPECGPATTSLVFDVARAEGGSVQHPQGRPSLTGASRAADREREGEICERAEIGRRNRTRRSGARISSLLCCGCGSAGAGAVACEPAADRERWDVGTCCRPVGALMLPPPLHLDADACALHAAARC